MSYPIWLNLRLSFCKYCSTSAKVLRDHLSSISKYGELFWIASGLRIAPSSRVLRFSKTVLLKFVFSLYSLSISSGNHLFSFRNSWNLSASPLTLLRFVKYSLYCWSESIFGYVCGCDRVGGCHFFNET